MMCAGANCESWLLNFQEVLNCILNRTIIKN